jgi:hypothetical protein
MDAPDTLESFMLRPEQLTAIVLFSTAALVAIFAILGMVRLWGAQMQKRSGACGGLDMAGLKQMRDAGEISQQEYDAVCAQITGKGPAPAKGRPAAPRAGPPAEKPIDKPETDNESRRSGSDGQE